MKKILASCGAGIATSTTVISKIKNLLDENGYQNQYSIKQIKVSEAPGLSSDADFLVSTTAKPSNLECDFVSGIPFLTGMGKEAVEKEILDLMEK